MLVVRLAVQGPSPHRRREAGHTSEFGAPLDDTVRVVRFMVRDACT